ncbi:hypothetical protein [uncultured Treponema sp.]|uniref:hypothetical protein n=1 Tax=uncultured Treponema sp. TaxID=162155 RepID=UPI0025CD2E0A|nr:hypothetical protein [uncultured Treponema sp.]
MKFKVSVFILIVFAFINIACLKNKTEEEFVEPVEVEEPVIQETFIEGKILRKNAELCLVGRDSAMHPVIKLAAGTDIPVLELDGVIDTKMIPDVESKPSAAETDSDKTEALDELAFKGTVYYHVVYDNIDFWLDKSVLAFNCENAVVVERTYMYSDADLTQKLDSPQNPLKFAAIVSKAKDEADAVNSKSVKIFYYDTGIKSVQEAFVSADSVSTRKDDQVVCQIVESLKTTTRAVPRNELFAKAAKYKPCKKVLAALNEQKVEKKTYNYQEVLKSMQRMSFGVNVDELMTVDQSKDPFK